MVVHRLTKKEHPNSPVRDFVAEVKIRCIECGGDFMFTGLDVAISTKRPCMNITRTEASIPITPWDGGMVSGTIPVEMP